MTETAFKEEGLILGHCQAVFILHGTESVAGAGDGSVQWSILPS